MAPFCQSEKKKGHFSRGKLDFEAFRIFKIDQLLGVPKLKKQQTPFEDIWPNGMIFHQPKFPWNSRGPISLTKPTIWGKAVVCSVAIILTNRYISYPWKSSWPNKECLG